MPIFTGYFRGVVKYTYEGNTPNFWKSVQLALFDPRKTIILIGKIKGRVNQGNEGNKM